MRRIFLIGYMGAGKTTMGKELSKQSGLSFIDLDHFMEGRYRKTVRQIFEEKGEEAFRQIEKRLCMKWLILKTWLFLPEEALRVFLTTWHT